MVYSGLKKYKIVAEKNCALVCEIYWAPEPAAALCSFVADYPGFVVQSIDEVN